MVSAAARAAVAKRSENVNIMELFTPEKYSDTVATIALIVSVVAVPASGYFSYKYAIKGERRKEFNVVADVIRTKLREHLSYLKQGIYPSGDYIKLCRSDYDSLIDVTPVRKRYIVRRLVNEYQRVLPDSSVIDEYGDLGITDFGPAIAALEKLMPYVERK